MLQACLSSLVRQVVEADVEPHIIVVDNEEGPNNRELVLRTAASSPIPFHYVHEPVRGISKARNAALDKAVGISSEWIAFIDDDEVAAPDWISALMAPEYRDTPVLMGKRVMVYPERTPFWYLGEQELEPSESESVWASTYNVRFSADLLAAGLRFNEKLGLMGGESLEFFDAAREIGFAIRLTERAVTYETAHMERLGYLGQMKQEYWFAAVRLRYRVREKGGARMMPLALWCLVRGAFEVTTSPLFLVAGSRTFKQHALAGGKQIATGFAAATLMRGHLPQPYRSIVGN